MALPRLGLPAAGPQFPVSGSPPFNPNAPDPRQPQQGGPGGILGAILGGGQRPMQQQPQQTANPDPGSLQGVPPLQRLLLGLGDIAAGFRGQPGPSQQLMAQRRAEYERKRQQYLQNLAVLEQFGGALEKTSLDQVDARRDQFKQVYETIAPGQGETFDAFLGDRGKSRALLEMAKESELLKMAIAQGASQADLLQIQKSPAFEAEAFENADRKNAPSVEKKVQAFLNSTDPELRAELDKAAKDGSITFAEVETLMQRFGTDGPEGTKLSPSEIGTYNRKQDLLAQRFPGLKADKAFLEEKDAKAKADLQVETQKRITTNAEKIRDTYERARAKSKPAEGMTPNAQANLFATADQRLAPLRQSVAALDRALDQRGGGVKDIELIFQFISGLDETAAREGEVALAQRVAGLKGFIESNLEKAKGTGIIGDTIREQIRDSLAGVRKDFGTLLEGRSKAFGSVAKSLQADPNVVGEIEGMGKLNQVAKPKERRQAIQADVDRLQKELGENATDEQILKALDEQGLDL